MISVKLVGPIRKVNRKCIRDTLVSRMLTGSGLVDNGLNSSPGPVGFQLRVKASCV